MNFRHLGTTGSGWLPAMHGGLDTVTLRHERTDISALVESALRPLLFVASHHGIELRVDAAGSIPRAVVDRDKIAWVIVTLAGNALRYVKRGDATDAGGHVIVGLRADATGRELVLTFEDDGPGVPVHQQPYLFDRRPGTLHAEGLSLGLVRDIVCAHGGRIRVESDASAEAHGTCVVITLPVMP